MMEDIIKLNLAEREYESLNLKFTYTAINRDVEIISVSGTYTYWITTPVIISR